jgi:hypothetical protein
MNSVYEDITKIQNRPWPANLTFVVAHKSFPSEPMLQSSFIGEECNLFELASPVYKGMIARFDPVKYPVVPGGWKENKSSWDKLCADLAKASLEHGGSPLKSNGSHGKNKDYKVLKCSHHRYYSAHGNQAGGVFRNHSLNNDRQNARKGDGKKQKKKTSTSLPVKENEDATCKVSLICGKDQYSFFVVCGLGHGTHEGHSRLASNEMPRPKRTIGKEAEKLAKTMRLKGARPGAIADTVEAVHGVKMTRRQVHQTTEMEKLASSLIGAEDMEKFKDCESDTDRVFAYLESMDCSYVALFHQKGDANVERKRKGASQAQHDADGLASSCAGADILLSESLGTNGTLQSSVVGETGANEMNENVMKYAQDTRVSVGAKDDQELLLAAAWVTPESRQKFQAFPEQVSMDGTHKTTAQDWELVTITVQDMNGGQDVVLYCWAPNNREWFFRWLLQTAVPTLVGRRTCERVRLILCDGDSQECAQVDASIVAVFVNAIRRRCGWHLIEKAWEREFGKQIGPVGHKNREKIDCLEREIKACLYSLMKEIETIAEYKT